MSIVRVRVDRVALDLVGPVGGIYYAMLAEHLIYLIARAA